MYSGCSHSAGIRADIISRPSEAVEHPLILCLYILAYADSSQYKLQSYDASGKVRIGRVLTCLSQVGQQSCTVGDTAFSKIQVRSVWVIVTPAQTGPPCQTRDIKGVLACAPPDGLIFRHSPVRIQRHSRPSITPWVSVSQRHVRSCRRYVATGRDAIREGIRRIGAIRPGPPAVGDAQLIA